MTGHNNFPTLVLFYNVCFFSLGLPGYLGCFIDSENRDVNDGDVMDRDNALTLERCINACAGRVRAA